MASDTVLATRPPDPPRRRLLDAARAAFVDHGFHATTMDMVAHGAGASKKTLYKLFASKEDLFAAVMEREREAVVDIRPDPSLPPEDALRDFLSRAARIVLSDASIALTRIATAEAARSPLLIRNWTTPPPGQERFALEEYLESLTEAGTHDFGLVEDAGRMLFGMALGAIHHELMVGVEAKVPYDVLDRRIGAAVGIFLRGCGSEPAPPRPSHR